MNEKKKSVRGSLVIIIVLLASCQVEPDIPEIIILDEEIQEDDIEEVIDIIIDDPVIEEPEPIQEIITMEYINDIDYHYPELLYGKSIKLKDTEGISSTWYFDNAGIILPTEMFLYPNPVTTEMFINAVEGQVIETVEITTLSDIETGFNYSLNMSGKFEYKGNLYYGEVDLCIVYIDGVLTINDNIGEFVNE